MEHPAITPITKGNAQDNLRLIPLAPRDIDTIVTRNKIEKSFCVARLQWTKCNRDSQNCRAHRRPPTEYPPPSAHGAQSSRPRSVLNFPQLRVEPPGLRRSGSSRRVAGRRPDEVPASCRRREAFEEAACAVGSAASNSRPNILRLAAASAPKARGEGFAVTNNLAVYFLYRPYFKYERELMVLFISPMSLLFYLCFLKLKKMPDDAMVVTEF